MTDRAVSLDLRAPAGDPGSLPARHNHSQSRGDAAEELVQRFQSALFATTAGESGDADAPQPSPLTLMGELARRSEATHREADPGEQDQARSDPTPPVLPANPAAFQAAVDRPAPTATACTPLMQMVAESATRMMVGDALHGERQVRIDIAEDTLPGVIVAIFQAAGEWVAQFTCTRPESFDSLAAPAHDMAQALADTLRAPACWLVEMNPPERSPVEARALPCRDPS